MLLTYSTCHRTAEKTLSRQQEEIVNSALEYSVQIVNRKLEELILTALGSRSDLRFVPMPATKDHTVETRLGLVDASASMAKALSGITEFVETAYIYDDAADYVVLSTHVEELNTISRTAEKAGFTLAEVHALHTTYSTGQLVVSENGQSMDYLLSMGMNRETGRPQRQLVIILPRDFCFASFLPPIRSKPSTPCKTPPARRWITCHPRGLMAYIRRACLGTASRLSGGEASGGTPSEERAYHGRPVGL